MQSRLLAVQPGDDMTLCMQMIFLLLAAGTITQPTLPPVSFNAVQQRDIACVAVIALAANKQKSGSASDAVAINLRINGKRWAAVVGNRIVAETAAPPELIGLAMSEAAKTEQAIAVSNPDQFADRIKMCVPLMQADLLANAPLPKPTKSK
jgi:hypothetical protein